MGYTSIQYPPFAVYSFSFFKKYSYMFIVFFFKMFELFMIKVPKMLTSPAKVYFISCWVVPKYLDLDLYYFVLIVYLYTNRR